jgi:type IV secretory pathway TrbD component
MAIGISCAVIGTTITWYLSILGVIIFLVTLLMWIRDTRRDISELPEDHTAH